jgi:hypothetical protein
MREIRDNAVIQLLPHNHRAALAARVIRLNQMPKHDSADDNFDDEDWYSEDDAESYDDAEAGHCPECSAVVYEFSERCPACGYYLSVADRGRLFAGESKPKWVLITATVVLVVLILAVLMLRF